MTALRQNALHSFRYLYLVEGLVVEWLGNLNDCPLDFFFSSVASVAGNSFAAFAR
jgi:hypothetical protein